MCIRDSFVSSFKNATRKPIKGSFIHLDVAPITVNKNMADTPPTGAGMLTLVEYILEKDHLLRKG